MVADYKLAPGHQNQIHVGGNAHHVFKVFGQEIALDVPIPALILALIGVVALARIVTSLITFFAETFLFSGIPLKSFGAKQNRWAVVTGCTSGIGEAFIRQLAKAGFNVCLIGRNEESLKRLKGEIAAKHPSLRTHHLSLDLAHPSSAQSAAYDALKTWASSPDVDIGVLVNNAGVSHVMPVAFGEMQVEEGEEILQVNIRSTLNLTRILLPNLLSHPKNRQSLILNIGSFASTSPSPYLATYSASKAFLTTWTKALGEEVREKGVVVRLVLPSFVVSKMSKIRRSSALVPTAPNFVASTLSSIGLNRGAQGRVYESTPFWSHAILDYVVASLPERLVIWYNAKLHKDIRRRALKKLEREKAKSQ